ncbi:phage tail sheath monomer [Trabulsiella guamensis ATCC 49490]|uniref:Phage tail sheath monomer n=1 Tax=Trabulsiella guamensis ATCC 49490 TaxID=1005994 RepID=A0A085ART8_9ENTR|nr:phage tail sheath C-terminal domain-containing protein [Trabulsiella guamensis]KFC12933.1 phage tail sheath monomer [Trabulsiella guamensis ATCC 49490]
MPDLHGVESIELTNGTIAVQTVETAVIGLVGTAPDAATATHATALAGSVLLNTQLLFTAVETGRAGNGIVIDAVIAEAETEVTTATMLDRVITVTLATDDTGAATSTVQELVDAIGAITGSPVTVSMENAAPDAVVSPFSETLAGGEDEPYPLNTPVLVAGALVRADQLGTAGTLYPALMDIFDQTGALVVVVRAEEGANVAATRASIISAIDKLPLARSKINYQPRIVIATGFSEDDGVGKKLEVVAQKLRAIAYLDSPSMATPQEVSARRNLYGGRVELLRPRVAVTADNGQTIYRPYSARAAGLRARIDYANGWWWSKSNQEIFGITGTEQIDDFIIGDYTCTANLLNMDNISTIIRYDGFRHWGNRLCLTHPQWRFEAVRRTADVIEDSIQRAMMVYVDRPIDKDVADDVIGSINAYIRQLKNLGAIYGGTAWLDPELNTAETMAAGWLYINYDFGPKSPMERLTLRVRVNKQYGLEELGLNGN